jgi:hypothetical protein
MRFFRNRLVRRFQTLALISDVAVVATTALRATGRSPSGASRRRISTTEWLLAGTALLRIARRLRRRRRAGAAGAPTIA